MNNFQRFKRKITPEQLAHWITCSSCPLYENKCDGFSSLGGKPKSSLNACARKLIKWFKEEIP